MTTENWMSEASGYARPQPIEDARLKELVAQADALGWEPRAKELIDAIATALRTEHAARVAAERQRDAKAVLVEQLYAKLTCMCGDYIEHHNTGSGHSPVAMYDYALDQAETRAEAAEAQVSGLLKDAAIERAEAEINRLGIRVPDITARDIGRCIIRAAPAASAGQEKAGD